MKILTTFALSIFLFSCSGNSTQQTSYSKFSNIDDLKVTTNNVIGKDIDTFIKIINIDTSINKLKFLDQTFKIEPDKVWSYYFNLMKTNLLKNEVPIFMYDECLDYNNMTYCYVNSHKFRSLRYDLLMKLTKKEILILLELSDNLKLNKVCSIDSIEGILYQNKSNFVILKNKLDIDSN